MAGQYFTIGVLSTDTGVKVETIRYYEKIGLLPAPARSGGGYRLYDPASRDRLAFIKRSRELGFSLDDIRALLGIDQGPPTCRDVQRVTIDHLERVRFKIADLKKLERTLSEVAARCEGGVTPECPIIDSLCGTKGAA